MSVTLLSIFRRREGMSHGEFVDYYEAFHAKIGEKVLAGYATRYVRRFTTPFAQEAGLSDPDVVMEIEFPDEATMQAFFASIADDPETAEMIRIDEDKLFDRGSMKVYRLDERISEMPPVG
ncbi:EthD domain-containing protein [Croceicoccus bisphenolivorans]|uniref:EthD domain-containing protein n=1 Tax=Croceicoccus bisphenolivorans TaxID=1783232 RepID=UPI00082FE74B|nr:EthD domain-containing protein [Croceicoccus bisphenolivorans]